MLIPAPLKVCVRAFGRRAAQDRRGVAALEFALIAPLMILLYVGLAQLSSAIIASRHASHAASSLGDLVSQCSSVSDNDLGNIFGAASDILAPLPVTTTVLNQRVSSVVVTSANGASPVTTQVQWSQVPTQTGLAAWSTGVAPPTPLPTNLVSNQGDSVIVSETIYTFNFPVQAVSNLFRFDNLAYFKPRKSAVVTYTGTGPGGTKSQTTCYS